MASLYTRPDSSFIWIRYYDKLEQDIKKRRKSISTKLLNNRDGWKAARELKRRLEAGIVEQRIEEEFGIKLKKRLLLTQGLEEFISKKPNLAERTIDAYTLSVKHFICCNTNKYIESYNHSDYSNLLKYFEKKGFSQTTNAINLRHLYALWNYFIKNKYSAENIIIKIKAQKGNPEPISFIEFQKILKYYKAKGDDYKHHYHFVYFLLLTGFRVSTALKLKWEEVDFNNEVIYATNVKAKRPFIFPIHKELLQLLNEMNSGKTGRIFYMFAEGESPKFWQRDIQRLVERAILGKKYTLHDIRKTFASWMADKGIDRSVVKELLDHSSISVTSEFYVLAETKRLKSQIEKIKFKKK